MLVTEDKRGVVLSAEQSKMVDVALSGRDVIVEATIGAGKTASIQALCSEASRDRRVLYLTYSKLLKLDAQRRVSGAKVQNYHGIVYPWLLNAGIKCGVGESIAAFNAGFATLSQGFPRYDLLVVDEYQDINEEYAQLLANIRSLNPGMTAVLVGDKAQKVRSDTRLDVQAFARSFTQDAVHLPYTQSFRMGPEMAELLSRAWGKPIVGMNTDQRVRRVDSDEALGIVAARRPGELLALGKRNGAMSHVLNDVERMMPATFNKDTVYASIRDGDRNVAYGDQTAVFTTFDSSKGLERAVSMVFDFDEANWEVRNGFPGADHEVLRNTFLVAASRGKEEIVFVSSGPAKGSRRCRPSPAFGEACIGEIPVRRFIELPQARMPVYERPWWAGECFDFKYAENVEACFALLATRRLDDGSSSEIEIERTEGLIDLSPVVGHYQEAVFFDGWSARDELRAQAAGDPHGSASHFVSAVTGDPWLDCLVLGAVSTGQHRYVDQVRSVVSSGVRNELVARLGTLLNSDCAAQVLMRVKGMLSSEDGDRTPVEIRGVADAVQDGTVFELKFTTELTHPMFLQLGLYLAMSGLERGVLWNIRTDERHEVQVLERTTFLDAVALCVTKQAYTWFEAE